MEEQESAFASLPFDIALKIASRLSLEDVIALGSCSKFWLDICQSDPLWYALFRKEWPDGLPDAICPSEDSNVDSGESNPLAKGQRWKSIYIKEHKERAWLSRASGASIARTRPLLFNFFDVCHWGMEKGLNIIMPFDYNWRVELWECQREAERRRKELERLDFERELSDCTELLRSGHLSEVQERFEISKRRRDHVEWRNFARRNSTQCSWQQQRTKKKKRSKSAKHFTRSWSVK